MDDLLKQVEAAIDGNAYYLALFVSLTLPDICGAMESQDGLTTRDRYVKWFDTYVASNYRIQGAPTITGETCYYYRCSLLHQGRSQHPNLGYARILFLEPGSTSNVFHNNILNDALNIDAGIFCRDIIAGVRKWIVTAMETEHFKRNYPNFMQRYPNGIAPYIKGTPVIG